MEVTAARGGDADQTLTVKYGLDRRICPCAAYHGNTSDFVAAIPAPSLPIFGEGPTQMLSA
jgi:hypothetical protein